MASRKLTQLPTATEVTTSDKIYIVDVSDTTESPQGTSKQALISELPSSGITSLTSTDGSIDIDLTDPDAPDLSIPNGTFTPVASDVTGSVSITEGVYSRSGQVVTMSFQFDGEAAAGTADIVFDFTLPVAATFTSGRQLFGSNSSNPNLALMIFQSNGDKGNVQISTQDVDQTIQTVSVTIQYFVP